MVDVENGIENTISGPATNFQVDPVVAARLGFTPTEVSEDATAILDGITHDDPLIANGRPYTIRVRLSDDHRKLARCDREHRLQQRLRPHRDARLARRQSSSCRRRTKFGAKTCSASSSSPAAWKAPTSARAHGQGAADRRRTCICLHRSASSMAAPTRNSRSPSAICCSVLLLALALVFGVLLTEFRNFPAPIAILTSSVLSISGVILALLITHTTFNVASFMGLIMVIGIVAKNGILLLDADEKFRAEGASAAEAMMHAAQRRLRPIVMTAIAAVCGMLPLAFALGAGSQMLQPLAIAVIGGLAISMVLSLVVTPVVYFLLTKNRKPQEESA